MDFTIIRKLNFLNYPKLQGLLRAEIVFENFPAKCPLDIRQRAVLATENLTQWGNLSLCSTDRLKMQTLSQEAAQPIERQVVLCLEFFTASQESIESAIPITKKELVPEIKQKIPRIRRRAGKELLHDTDSISPPGFPNIARH